MKLRNYLNEVISKIRSVEAYKEVEDSCSSLIEEIKSSLPYEKKHLVDDLCKEAFTQDIMQNEQIFIEGVMLGTRIPNLKKRFCTEDSQLIEE